MHLQHNYFDQNLHYSHWLFQSVQKGSALSKLSCSLGRGGMVLETVLAVYLAIIPTFVIMCVVLIFLDIHILPQVYISILDPIMSV